MSDGSTGEDKWPRWYNATYQRALKNFSSPTNLMASGAGVTFSPDSFPTFLTWWRGFRTPDGVGRVSGPGAASSWWTGALEDVSCSFPGCVVSGFLIKGDLKGLNTMTSGADIKPINADRQTRDSRRAVTWPLNFKFRPVDFERRISWTPY